VSNTPFMQLYIGDYLRDTQGLTTEGHGAYLLLLMAMWNAGGYLPADAKKLARFARCTPSRWAKIAPDLMPFFDLEDGQISQKRLLIEREKASEKSIKRAEVGSLGGRAKALKNKEPAVAKAIVLPEHSPETRNQKIEEAKASLSKRGKGFEEFWQAYPTKVGKRAASDAYDRALGRIDDPDPPAVILAAVRLAAERSQKWRQGYIPNPQTWLNQDRWNDQFDQTVIPLDPRHERSDAPSAKRLRNEGNHARAFDGALAAAVARQAG